MGVKFRVRSIRDDRYFKKGVIYNVTKHGLIDKDGYGWGHVDIFSNVDDVNNYMNGIGAYNNNFESVDDEENVEDIKLSKFKVGDRVSHNIFGLGTIVDNDDRFVAPCLVQFDKKNSSLHDGNGLSKFNHGDSDCYWCDDEDIKLADETHKFTKADLKNGMIVVRRNGEKLLVMMREDSLVKWELIGINEQVSDDEFFREDLTHTNWKHGDIMEVYRPKYLRVLTLDLTDAKLLYKREEPKEMTLTLTEIEKALGYSVKIVD